MSSTFISSNHVSPIINNSVLPIIQSTGQKIVPARYKDYTGLPAIISGASSSHATCAYPLHKYISYHIFSPQHKSFLANVTIIHVPYTYKQAVIHKH